MSEFRYDIVDPRPPEHQGGQQAGSAPYAVKVTHLPSGLVSQCGLGRSQHKNKVVAEGMIEYALHEFNKLEPNK